jgi:hypothetical protein
MRSRHTSVSRTRYCSLMNRTPVSPASRISSGGDEEATPVLRCKQRGLLDLSAHCKQRASPIDRSLVSRHTSDSTRVAPVSVTNVARTPLYTRAPPRRRRVPASGTPSTPTEVGISGAPLPGSHLPRTNARFGLPSSPSGATTEAVAPHRTPSRAPKCSRGLHQRCALSAACAARCATPFRHLTLPANRRGLLATSGICSTDESVALVHRCQYASARFLPWALFPFEVPPAADGLRGLPLRLIPHAGLGGALTEVKTRRPTASVRQRRWRYRSTADLHGVFQRQRAS